MDTLLPLDRQSLPASMDAQTLLREARAQVEALASERWTDYNTHDPGITILEHLVYALTDLGLRSRLDIADYLAGAKNSFFTAREVLPNAPGTITDFRRLLIDRPGIRNAWLEDTPGDINGLHTLLLDLEPAKLNPGSNTTEELDLNTTWLKGNLTITENGKTYDYYVIFPAWEEMPTAWAGKTDLTDVALPPEKKFGKPDDPDKVVYDQYYIETIFHFGPLAQQTLELWIRLPQGISKENVQEEVNFLAALRTKLHGNLRFFQTHQQRARLRKLRLTEAEQFTRGHRNLCEDWSEIGTIRVQEIGVQLDGLELSPGADPVAVLARIYFLLEQFIDPHIRPLGFEQLRALERPAADIFEGPLLTAGFLPDDQLHAAQRADSIYTSDLVRIVMEQPEVTGIARLTLEHYTERLHTATRVTNCLNLRNPRLYKPKFSFEDSAARVTKRGVGLTLDREAVRTKWLALKAAYAQDLPANGDGDLPVPAGEHLDIGAYYSVQNEFPQVYGLRAGEIPDSAPASRRAQAKQLKGYLCLFDQLMANHTAQLANLGKLFSSDDIRQTYFYQPLYQTPAVQEVIDAYLNDKTTPSWSDFQQDKEDNAYLKGLKESTESDEQFHLRRNLFLDHLLARLGEDFSEYSAWAISSNGGQIPDDLIRAKLAFLRQAPELSSRRGVAFDYTATRVDANGKTVPDIWDTENVSGYEKRVAALLGMSDCRRRTLHNARGVEEGLHLIEHALLRPIESGRNLLKPISFLPDNDPFIADPYSYQVSIFLPGGAGRFRDIEFRALVERVLRRELPAHLFAWIYWVKPPSDFMNSFEQFESAYRDWLESLHTNRRKTKQDNLVAKFNALISSKQVELTNRYNVFDASTTDTT